MACLSEDEINARIILTRVQVVVNKSKGSELKVRVLRLCSTRTSPCRVNAPSHLVSIQGKIRRRRPKVAEVIDLLSRSWGQANLSSNLFIFPFVIIIIHCILH